MPISADERRFTLLTLLSRRAATAQDIAQLPAYRDRTGDALQRMIERDIETLRDSGHTIRVSADYRYSLDKSGTVTVDFSGLDSEVLRKIISTKGRTSVEAFAQFGAAQMLGSDSGSTTTISPYRLHVPRGDEVVAVAQAISTRSQIFFRYERHDREHSYLVEPWKISIHFGVFYLTAGVVERDGEDYAGQSRVFKLTRVSGDIAIKNTACQLTPPATTDSILAPIDVTLWLANDQLPLAQRGQIVERQDDGVLVEYFGVDRWDMIEDVLFHGSDVHIVHPQWFRDDVEHRIAHAQEVSDGIR